MAELQVAGTDRYAVKLLGITVAVLLLLELGARRPRDEAARVRTGLARG